MSHYPEALLSLMAFLKKFPGVGSRTAERFAFHLLDWPEEQLKRFGSLVQELRDQVHYCEACGCLMEEAPCNFCDPIKRDGRLLCIVSSAKDVFALEETRTYQGLYHVIGGLLSPIDGKSIEKLHLETLIKRIQSLGVKEVILALDSTLEGDATSLYLKEQINLLDLPVSRLAFGLPLGSTLDFVDGGTLARALTGRRSF